MKKGQIYEGRIQEVEFPNKGKIFIPEEEKTVVVKNGAPRRTRPARRGAARRAAGAG